MPAIDACKIGFCNFYDAGQGVFGFIGGIVVGVLFILAIQRIGKRRKDR